MSDEPTPLLEDPSVPDALRADLNNAASQPAVDYDIAAGLEALRASLATGPIGGGSGGAGAGTSGGALVAAGVGAALVLGIGGYFGYEALSTPSVDVPAVTQPPELEVDSIDEAPVEEPVEAALPDELAEPDLDQDPEEAPVDEPPLQRRADRPDEITHLATLRRHVQAGDHGRVLALANEGQRLFPRGLYRQEREAYAVLSLARLGRSGAARRRGERFLLRYPTSPFAQRVQSVVAGGQP